jgi:hypothetical protein
MNLTARKPKQGQEWFFRIGRLEAAKQGLNGHGHAQSMSVRGSRAEEQLVAYQRCNAGAEEERPEGELSEWKKNHRVVAYLCLAPACVRKCTHQGTKPSIYMGRWKNIYSLRFIWIVANLVQLCTKVVLSQPQLIWIGGGSTIAAMKLNTNCLPTVLLVSTSLDRHTPTILDQHSFKGTKIKMMRIANRVIAG